MHDQQARVKVSLLSIYSVFFQIGIMSFGGGLVSWIHREVVNVRGWMRDEEFLSGMALAQILPGVNSTNTAVFVGQRVRGLIGASVALLAMLTGPFFAVLLTSQIYQSLITLPGATAVLEGIAAVAVGLIMRLGIQAARRSRRGVVSITVMIIIFVYVGVLKLPMIATIAIMAPLSVVAAYLEAGKDA